MIAAINLADWFGSLLNVETPAKFFVVIALIVCCATVVITIVVTLSTLSIHRAELEFKRDLVERGLNIDDIERLLAAKSKGKSRLSCGQSAKASASVSRV